MDYKKLTKTELLDICKKQGLEAKASNTKDQLVKILESADKAKAKAAAKAQADKAAAKPAAKPETKEEPKTNNEPQASVQSNGSSKDTAKILGIIGGVLYLVGALLSLFFMHIEVAGATIANVNFFKWLGTFDKIVFIATIVLTIVGIIMITKEGKNGGIVVIVASIISALFFLIVVGAPFSQYEVIIANLGWIAFLVAGIIKVVKA